MICMHTHTPEGLLHRIELIFSNHTDTDSLSPFQTNVADKLYPKSNISMHKKNITISNMNSQLS